MRLFLASNIGGIKKENGKKNVVVNYTNSSDIEAFKNIGDEKLATCFSQQSKEAYNKIIGKSLDMMR